MDNLNLSSFLSIDLHRDYELFCIKRMDKCILWMWIFCLLQAFFVQDVIFPKDSMLRLILFAIMNTSWLICIIIWIRWFIESLRAHRKVMTSIRKLEKAIFLPSVASSKTTSRTLVPFVLQQGNSTNG